MPLNLDEYEAVARERLDAAAHAWFAGGAGDEWTLRENRRAFSRWHLRPRVLAGGGETATRTTVLGRELALPVLVAPVGFQRLAHPEGEAATAAGAASAGTVMCVSTMANASLAEIEAAAPGAPRWYQLYGLVDHGMTRALVTAAVEAGVGAIVLTADAPRRGRHETELRAGFELPATLSVPAVAMVTGESSGTLEEQLATDLTWDYVSEVREWSGLPVVVKGVLTAEDALLACEAGAAAVVVSNHGGRQLDGVPASLDVLSEVVEAVAGRAEVLLDGGVRRGVDVLKALALGARAVLVGRPAIWGLAAAGQAGVEHVLELLREEIDLGLALLGCREPGEVSRSHVGRMVV